MPVLKLHQNKTECVECMHSIWGDRSLKQEGLVGCTPVNSRRSEGHALVPSLWGAAQRAGAAAWATGALRAGGLRSASPRGGHAVTWE